MKTVVLYASALLALGCGSSTSEPEPTCSGGKCDGTTSCSPATQGLDVADAFAQTPFKRPVQLLQRPGNASHWYVVEQRGVISRFANTPTSATREVVLDLRTRTRSSETGGGGEAGMFSIAFHPDFNVNGEVFVSYTGATQNSPAGMQSRISKFVSSDNGKTFAASSEVVLLAISQPFSNHNGGQIAFGPDRMLYIGFGDGGSAGDPMGNGQNVDDISGCATGTDKCALLGKVLRIDVDGGTPFGIPSDNPFAGGTPCAQGGAGPCPEIYATGIRNPWRFSFDRATGQLWLADVGQDAFEEVNIIERGKNYGWRFREGNACFSPAQNCPSQNLIGPVAVYGRSLGVSITGGFVYRGTAIPSMVGQYVFGDFGSGRMFATLKKSDGTFASRIADETGRNLSSFGEGADGELYTLDFSAGRILKIVAGQCTDGSTPPPLPDHLYLSRDGVGTEAEANGYYASTIPGFTPGALTLDAWITEHTSGPKVSAFYRNANDLGSWREMTCTKTIARGSGGCWVRAWRDHDDKANGKPSLGTVAMNVSAAGFVRFYAFTDGGKLSPKTSFDSEGDKFLPRVCTPCHNGQYLGSSSAGDVGAVFREFEPSLLEPAPGANQAALKLAWFELNQAIRTGNAALRSEAEGGPSGIDHAKDAIEDYVGSIYSQTNPPVARDVGDAAHIPASWKQGTPALVTAQANLWTKAINRNCMGCHRVNSINLAELSTLQQLGPNGSGKALLRTYLEMDPSTGKGPLAIMPQAEIMFENLHSNPEALGAINAWLAASGEQP
ncbi:MAG: PQQ-dependent sugar dehydrogenase [Deltaproteobacteria bacterium]|nr:PQQ-dependent sugar dehydrogenase [Deltaproteobacteria bacterium]